MTGSDIVICRIPPCATLARHPWGVLAMRLFMLLPLPVRAADREKVGEWTNGEAQYLDKKSIQPTDDGHYSAWTKKAFPNQKQRPETILIEFSCTGKSRVLDWHLYNDIGIDQISPGSAIPAWEYIKPDSIEQTAQKIVCKK